MFSVKFSKFDYCFVYLQLGLILSILHCSTIARYPLPSQMGNRDREIRSYVVPCPFCHRNYFYFFWITQRASGSTLQGMKSSCVGSPNEWRQEEHGKSLTILLHFAEKYGSLFLPPFSFFLLTLVCKQKGNSLQTSTPYCTPAG